MQKIFGLGHKYHPSKKEIEKLKKYHILLKNTELSHKLRLFSF